jgi:pimeloyl-ACP methyl ester carboxylesterase
MIAAVQYGVMEPDRLGATRLASGRPLGWSQWGPDTGRPVLFFSGAAMGRSLGFGAAAVGRLGARLIAVERPGLGASDPNPERTLTDWPRDVAELCTILGLSDVRIVGFSQGAPFALACAEAGVGEAVAIVSGQDDLQHPAFAAVLNPDVARLVQAASDDPTGVEAMFAASGSAEMLWNLIVRSSSEVDLAIYTSPDFEAAFKRALAEGFAQGAAGYARDLVLALGRWPFELAAIRVPVDLWYGGHDASAVHSPDHGATLIERIPTGRRHLRPEAGGSLLWTHAEEILSTLISGSNT